MTSLGIFPPGLTPLSPPVRPQPRVRDLFVLPVSGSVQPLTGVIATDCGHQRKVTGRLLRPVLCDGGRTRHTVQHLNQLEFVGVPPSCLSACLNAYIFF